MHASKIVLPKAQSSVMWSMSHTDAKMSHIKAIHPTCVTYFKAITIKKII